MTGERVRAARQPADLSDAELVDLFAWFHDDGLSLSEIGRRLNGLPYYSVRRVLTGESETRRTERLRGERPPFTGSTRGVSTSLSDSEIGLMFRLYHEQGKSVAQLAAAFKVVPSTIRDTLSGRVAGGQTRGWRDYYGSRLRSPGNPLGESRPRRKAG